MCIRDRLGADRSVTAFDAASGRKLWQSQRPGDALVLRQSGILAAVGNTLIAGVSGRLVGLNPSNGNAVWDAPLATPRGTNAVSYTHLDVYKRQQPYNPTFNNIIPWRIN